MQGSITIPPTTTSGAPEGHDEAMLARYEAGQTAAAAGLSTLPVEPPVVPPVVPPVEPPVVPPVVPPAVVPPVAPPAAPSADFVDNLVTSAGLTREGLTAEYTAGGLSEASYAALAAKGVDKAAVDNYFAGQVAQAEAAQSAYTTAVITATVGTPEKYAELVTWAKTLTPAEQQAYNEAVESGDTGRAAFAVAGLNARFLAANPAEPRLLDSGLPQGGVAKYESWAQAKKDMASVEYKTDHAFRDKVKARLAVSPNLS